MSFLERKSSSSTNYVNEVILFLSYCLLSKQMTKETRIGIGGIEEVELVQELDLKNLLMY